MRVREKLADAAGEWQRQQRIHDGSSHRARGGGDKKGQTAFQKKKF
jgi:hypothetical protein